MFNINNDREKWNDANDSFSREWRREMNPYPDKGENNPYQSGSYRSLDHDIDFSDIEEEYKDDNRHTASPVQDTQVVRRKKIGCLVLVLLFVTALAIFVNVLISQDRQALEEADAAMAEQNYTLAYDLYRDAWANDVTGAEEKMYEAAYRAARGFFAQDKYEDAAFYFSVAGDYKDAQKLYTASKYYEASGLFSDENYIDAAYTLLDVFDYLNSEEMLKSSIQLFIDNHVNLDDKLSGEFNQAYLIAKKAKDKNHICGRELYSKYFGDCPEISLHLYANDDEEETYYYFKEGDTVWVEITFDSTPAQGSTVVCYCYVNGEENFSSGYDGVVHTGKSVYEYYDASNLINEEYDYVSMYIYTEEGFYLGSIDFEIWP